MLLLLESVDNRINYDNGVISQRKRIFAALQRGGRNHRDLLLTLPLNTPTKLDISPNETAMVTLLDANHCPGSVMCATFPTRPLNIADTVRNFRFLIEGKRGAVLHTGDVRAEPAMVSQLAQSVHMAPYLFANGQQQKQLEAVYLDTASLIGTQIVPSKANAVQGLVDIISMYPEDTLFYLNIWTWGYEDILLGIAERFDTKIHVDRHKYLVLCSVEHYHSSPSFSKSARPGVLKNILTCDEHETRFHACERYNQCTTIKPTDPEPKRRTHRNSLATQVPIKRVVWINPGVVASSNWGAYIQEVKDQLKDGQFVDTLKVPLSRHSTLTELQSFIALLRPKNIYPTTMTPSLEGLDWACVPGIFAEYLPLDGYELLRRTMLKELQKRFPDIDLTPDGMAKRAEQVLLKVGHPDLEQENAVGSDEIEWTEARFQRAIKTKEHIDTYLPWLFGAPSSETTQCISAKNPTRASSPPLTDSSTHLPTMATTIPSELCSTCVNCPTCRPKPPNRSPGKISDVELEVPEAQPDPVDLRLIPSFQTGSSETHAVGLQIIQVQRNEQMYSPPPESPKLDLHLEKHGLRSSASITWNARPKKRLRTNSAASPRNSPVSVKPSEIINPQSALLADRTQTATGPSVSLELIQPNSSVNGPQNTIMPLPKRYTALHDLRRDAHPNPTPNDQHRTPAQTITTLPPHARTNYNDRHLSSTSIISLASTTSSATTKESVPFSESDIRERRRMSKVKERDIRAQLAKLPPEFSQALAATKPASKP
ncbi:unnamed protein product [Rhizoctonia solani]|uniref:Protein artemis n=1 Tax=Rhizoctonia solani TaxID=456999 RepID=A0A8H3HF16_9AGAM|nr:unnamed protein product [Rhizoctonia solani]